MSDVAVHGFETVAILGTGLIGGSLAISAGRVEGVRRVRVWDRDPAVLARARVLGVGHEACASLEEAVAGADLVVLASPVDSLLDLAGNAANCMSTTAVLTDVGSVKGRIVTRIARIEEIAGRFVGGHPMAGKERGGIDAADGLLFQGATWVLTPAEDTLPEVADRLEAFVRALGAWVVRIAPDVHDEVVATVSHLPQVLASLLMGHAAEEARVHDGLFAVAAGGFRDVTRVAASDPDLWLGIVRENRAAIRATLTGYAGRLGALAAAIEHEDWDEVREAFARGRAARVGLPDKPVEGALVDLVVPLDDRPGALAEVTQALGAADVNIEDLSLRHASEGGRGALIIAVAGRPAAERAQSTLAARGYHVHIQPR